jgi:hypothetical protein
MTTVSKESWCFISGVTAVAETRLLTDDELLDLVGLPSLDAVFQRLKQVETYVHLAMPESPDGATRAVEAEFLRLVKRYASETPDARVADAALLSRRFGDARAFAREKLFPEEKRRRPPTLLTEEELELLWNGSCDARPGLAPAVARVRDAVEKSGDAKTLVDLLFDREELLALSEAVRSLGAPLLDGWVALAVRLRAALTVVRARLAGEDPERLAAVFLAPSLAGPRDKPLADDWLLALAEEDVSRLGETFARGCPGAPGEATSLSRASVARLARLVDDRLTEALRDAKYITYGPERPFAYLWALNTENLNLRFIVETFVVEADREETRTRLRRSYV